MLLLMLMGISAGAQKSPEMVIVLLNSLGLGEWDQWETPKLDSLLETGALGLISSRGLLELSDQGTYVFSSLKPFLVSPGPCNLGLLTMEGDMLKEYPLTLVQNRSFQRLDEIRPYLMDEEYEDLMEKAFLNLDTILDVLICSLQPKDLLLLISLKPPQEFWSRGERLGWVLIVGQGFSDTLYSSSTRKIGLLTFEDLLITLKNHGDMDQKGNPLSSLPQEETGEFLLSFLRTQGQQFTQRTPFIQGFVAIQVILIFSTFFALLKRRGGYLPALFHGGALLWPLFILYIPPSLKASSALFLSLVLALGFYVFIRWLCGSLFWTMGIVSLLVFLSIWSDLLFGWGFLGSSYLGYSAVVGARFYGLGNEFMGLYLGSGVLSLAILGRGKGLLFLLGGTGLICLGLGAGDLGANWGGLITALGTCSYFLYSYLGKGILLSLFLLPPAFVFLDLVNGDEMSHYGSLFLELGEARGWTNLMATLKRKMAMNRSLWGWTPWSRIFSLFLLGFGVALFVPGNFRYRLARAHPLLYRGLMSLTLGAGLAVLVNDSGVVAGATTLYVAVHALLLILLEDRNKASSLLEF